VLRFTVNWLGPGAGDRKIVVYEELAAGERDGLSFQRGIELNRVSIIGGSDRTAQRVGTAVVGVCDDDVGRVNIQGCNTKCARADRKQ
jgi:hypothetical protein